MGLGQEKFRSIATNCVRNAHGVMLVYDVMDVNSFSAISDWMKFVDDYAPSDANRILIGNKLDVGDQRRMVPQKHGKVRTIISHLFSIPSDNGICN